MVVSPVGKSPNGDGWLSKNKLTMLVDGFLFAEIGTQHGNLISDW